MESITKNRQPEETLRAMAARAYGPGQVPAAGEDWVCELGHGWFNVAYLMRLRDGSRVVLKIAPPSGVEVLTYERDAMATELAALRLIRERTTVPVPAVDFADQSRELCDADYFFMAYIVSIIDHERAFYGDPLIEGGFTATELPAFGDPAAFMRGYGHGELTEAERVRRRLYCLYLTLVMVIETVYRGHLDPRQYDFAREQLTAAMVLLGMRRQVGLLRRGRRARQRVHRLRQRGHNPVRLIFLAHRRRRASGRSSA